MLKSTYFTELEAKSIEKRWACREDPPRLWWVTEEHRCYTGGRNLNIFRLEEKNERETLGL